jgi:hypothetical protein
LGVAPAPLAIGCLGAAAPELPPQLFRPDGKPADMTKPVKVFILLGQRQLKQ